MTNNSESYHIVVRYLAAEDNSVLGGVPGEERDLGSGAGILRGVVSFNVSLLVVVVVDDGYVQQERRPHRPRLRRRRIENLPLGKNPRGH